MNFKEHLQEERMSSTDKKSMLPFQGPKCWAGQKVPTWGICNNEKKKVSFTMVYSLCSF